MGKYDHRQHVLSDWLTELEQRFQLGDVDTDKGKITWCQLLIGATGSSILAGLEDDASWEVAKEMLLSHLGVGSVRDKAWAALKELKRGSKEIVELAGEAEKLAKRLHPRDAEAAERHAINAFLGAVDRSLAAEVQKLGFRTMEEVVAAARRIERMLGEQPNSKIEQIVLSMQDQIRILTKDLLGLAVYYRRYVKGFAAIAGPLHALTRKDAVFHWSAECQAAFDQLKHLLTTSPITAFPDFSQAFRLYTDTSTAGLGAILAQVRDGKECIICCASRALNQAEKAYPATKLDCLAIVWAVAKFRPYLMAMLFEVYTDHYALQWLKTMRTGSALLHRWSAALEEYDFTVHHHPGKAQSHVDGLSRLPVGPTPSEDTLLHIQLNAEEEARKLAQELHSTTHLGGQALWKLFSDRYAHKAGRRLCIEVAQSCPQCQQGAIMGTV